MRTKLCECGNSKSARASTCKECYDGSRSIQEYTLSYWLKEGKYSASKLHNVRRNAKEVLIASGVKRQCVVCLNDEFYHVLEVCHLKGVMTFDPYTVTIKEINDVSNLVWMCPSHHALFDKGLLKYENCTGG